MARAAALVSAGALLLAVAASPRAEEATAPAPPPEKEIPLRARIEATTGLINFASDDSAYDEALVWIDGQPVPNGRWLRLRMGYRRADSESEADPSRAGASLVLTGIFGGAVIAF